MSGLVLRLQPGDSVAIGDDVLVGYSEPRGNRAISLLLKAPRALKICRAERIPAALRDDAERFRARHGHGRPFTAEDESVAFARKLRWMLGHALTRGVLADSDTRRELVRQLDSAITERTKSNDQTVGACQDGGPAVREGSGPVTAMEASEVAPGRGSTRGV